MCHLQKPIGSGFDHDSSSDDVLTGVDLAGKLALVTGGHSGLGLETTHALLRAGAEVIVAARDKDAATVALRELERASVVRLDLADLASVARAARSLTGCGKKLDMLINNAGIMAVPETRVGPGWEGHFAINHLGHFALTLGLIPILAEGSRVVCVSSLGHHASPIRWDDVQFERGYDKWLAYAQSKTAVALFAVHLDKLVADRGIRSFSLHPGKIFTPLQRHLVQSEMVEQGWIDREGHPADPEFKSIAQGAATQLWAATSPRLNDLGGLYAEDCDIARLAPPEATYGVCSFACDPEDAERLWAVSTKLAGLPPKLS